jgi:CTP:molybdopterin cytidylyltransferase MocA
MRIGAVILAAGSGTRMGGVAKALLRHNDRTFLATIIETAQSAAVDLGHRDTETQRGNIHREDSSPCLCVSVSNFMVVVGPPFGDVVAAHARELGARVVVNDDPSRGMSSSINLGFAALVSPSPSTSPSTSPVAGDIDAAWLWPVDHPDVRASTLRALVDALGSHDVARPVFDGRGGHPPLVRRALFAQLSTCSNARDVIAAADVVNVEVDDKGTIEDVDHR